MIKYSYKKQTEITEEDIVKNLESIFADQFKVDDYQLDMLEDGRRLTVEYQITADIKSERALLDERKIIYDELMKYEIFNLGLEHILLLGKIDDVVAFESPMNAVKPSDLFFYQLLAKIVILYISITLLLMINFIITRFKKTDFDDDELPSPETLRMHIETHPKDGEALLKLAYVLNVAEQYEEAQLYIVKASQLKPRCEITNILAGRIHYMLGEYEKALMYYKASNSISTYFNDYMYYYNVGDIYAQLGEKKKSYRSYKHSKKIIKGLSKKKRMSDPHIAVLESALKKI